MEARKLDRLFKNKVQDVRDEHIADSWAKMELMLDEKKSSSGLKRVWIAAASVLFLVSWIAVYQLVDSSDRGTVLQDVQIENQNEKPLTADAVLPEPEEAKTQVVSDPEPEKQVKVERSRVKDQKIVIRSTSVKSSPEKIIQNEPENIEPVQEDKPLLEEAKPKKRLPVRITYKRSNRSIIQDELLAEDESDTTKQRKLKQFFEKNNLDPNELWADVRDAKDRLVQKAVNFKNKNVKNSKTKDK